MLKILPLTVHDAPTISSLAREIWLRHYQNISSLDQINYMLAQRYCPILIKTEVMSENIWWMKLLLGKTIIGFSSCILTEQPGELKIDKLYIHSDHQRKGYGAALINRAVETMHHNNCHSLILTVNKQNHTAISAYQKYGFKILGDHITDIGNGFVMDDYLMSMTKL